MTVSNTDTSPPTIESLSIDLNNKERVFWGGDIIDGTVHISVRNPVQIGGLYVSIHCLICASWREKLPGREKSDLFQHKEMKVPYHDQYVILPGVETLTAGMHSYPFQIELKKGLIGSFTAKKHIFVRWSLQARIIQLSGLDDTTCDLTVGVIGEASRDILQRYDKREGVNEVKGGLFKTPLKVKLTLMTSDFHGDIDADIEIDNQSNTQLPGYTLSLKRHVKVTGFNELSRWLPAEEVSVCTVNESVGGQLTKREIVRVPDEVKSTPQFTSEHIEMVYSLTLSVHKAKKQADMSVTLPVFIRPIEKADWRGGYPIDLSEFVTYHGEPEILQVGQKPAFEQ